MARAGTKLARLGESAAEAGKLGHSGDLLPGFRRALGAGIAAEEAYRAAVPLAHRKRFAQFFTPPAIARSMALWIAAIRPRTVLDPAVGPGIFPRLVRALLPAAKITAIDLDPVALAAAQAASGHLGNVEFLPDDFLDWSDSRCFDAVIANPPYLRHHDLHYPYDVFRAVGSRNGVAISRLSNIYALFVFEICRRLGPGGRAAVLVPGEWVNANFGSALKEFLLTRGYLRTLLYFSHASQQFEDALTTASALFLEKPPGEPAARAVRTVFLGAEGGIPDLGRLMDEGLPAPPGAVVRHFPAAQLLGEKKWDHLLSAGARSDPAGFVPLAALAATRRGIATGCNSFFLLKPSARRKWGIRGRSLLPSVGSARDAAFLVFRPEDFRDLVRRDRPAHLLHFGPRLSKTEAAYIRHGEREGLHRRYLCAARKPAWYAMEKRPPSAIWASVFGRKGLRFIHNDGAVRNLTAFHCIYPLRKDRVFARALTACLNSPTVQALARRQLRVYGGGLLKVEPKDLLEIAVPDLGRLKPATLALLASCLESLDAATRFRGDERAALERLDAAVLGALDEIRCRATGPGRGQEDLDLGVGHPFVHKRQCRRSD